MTAIQDRYVLVEHSTTCELFTVRPSTLDGLRARVRSHSLDARLAAGEAPENSRLLAVRAMQLTSPAMRRRIARSWAELAERSQQPRSIVDPRVPTARRQIAAASEQIDRVIELLLANRPVSARGVAIASTLLTTAHSPVYRVGGAVEDVVAAVARAIIEL